MPLNSHRHHIDKDEDLYVHLDIEDYKAIKLKREKTDPQKFSIKKMVPPNKKILFFFSNMRSHAFYDKE
jgi:hypothetical protein